jgi:selenide, water dikinase
MQEITFKELVLIGGGHGHVHVLKMIGMKSIPGVRVTLISRDVDTPYSGMLPGYVAGQYTREQCHLDLRQICSFASIRFLQGEVCGLDTTRKLIYFKDSERPPLSYHVVCLSASLKFTIYLSD